MPRASENAWAEDFYPILRNTPTDIANTLPDGGRKRRRTPLPPHRTLAWRSGVVVGAVPYALGSSKQVVRSFSVGYSGFGCAVVRLGREGFSDWALLS